MHIYMRTNCKKCSKLILDYSSQDSWPVRAVTSHWREINPEMAPNINLIM